MVQTPTPRVPPIPQGSNPRVLSRTLANPPARARAWTPILHSTYLGWAELSVSPVAFLSFLPPTPSSSCWPPPGALALASRRSCSPDWLSLGAHSCPLAASSVVVTASREQWPPRMVPEALLTLSLGAGWSWQSVRLCLLRAHGAPHASRAPRQPQVQRRGEVQAAPGKEGPGPGVPRERERAEKEERNREARN